MRPTRNGENVFGPYFWDVLYKREFRRRPWKNGVPIYGPLHPRAKMWESEISYGDSATQRWGEAVRSTHCLVLSKSSNRPTPYVGVNADDS